MAVLYWLFCLAAFVVLGAKGQERFAPGVPPPRLGGAGDYSKLFILLGFIFWRTPTSWLYVKGSLVESV